MSRFASPLKKSKESKSRKDFKSSFYSTLPPPPPPPPPSDPYPGEELEETKSISTTASASSRRSKSNGILSEKMLKPKPFDQDKTLLLTRQLISTLHEETARRDQPENVFFQSRVYERSEIIRQCRHEIVCVQEDWGRYASQAIEQVQQLNLDIIKFRETSEALARQSRDKEEELGQKKLELDKLYSHLLILEKEALGRGIKWMRPPLIRSNVPTVSPRNIALSIASTGANLGHSQPSDVNWKLELSELISSTTTRPQDDSSETKSENNFHEPSQVRHHTPDHLLAEIDSQFHEQLNQNNSPELPQRIPLASYRPEQSPKPHRQAPRAPLGRPGGLVDSEIKRLSPSPTHHDQRSDHEFLTIDNLQIPFDQWILASMPPEPSQQGDKARSSTPIKWKAEKMKLSALIPPPPPPPPPPLPPRPPVLHEEWEEEDHSSLGDGESHNSEEMDDGVEQDGSDRSQSDEDNLNFGEIFGLRSRMASSQPSQRQAATAHHSEDEADDDLIELSRSHPFPKLSSRPPVEANFSDEEEEEEENNFRFIATETESQTDDQVQEAARPTPRNQNLNVLQTRIRMDSPLEPEEEEEDNDVPAKDPAVRDWYTGRKIPDDMTPSPSRGLTHIPTFDPSDRLDWRDVRYNDLDPDDEDVQEREDEGDEEQQDERAPADEDEVPSDVS
jgi:hypothetical protein